MGIVSSEIRVKKLTPMFRQLATAYDAGIPLVQAFELLKREQKDRELTEMLTRMQETVKQGGTLGDAVSAESRKLPSYAIALIKAGEQGGKLDVMFRDLADYFEDRLEMQRQMLRWMAYPIVLLTATWFLGTFALRLVIKLPDILLSGKPFSLNGYFEEYIKFQTFAGLVFAGICVLCIVLARMGLMRWIWGLFSTHVWPLAPITKRFALARFCRSLALLVDSGLPIVQSIERAAAVTANPYIQRDLLRSVPYVKEGASLTQALSVSKYLLPTAREMIYVGEESGKLEESLRKVSRWYLDEASHAAAIATRVLYFIVYFAAAGLVLYVVYTFYSRLYGGMLDAIG